MLPLLVLLLRCLCATLPIDVQVEQWNASNDVKMVSKWISDLRASTDEYTASVLLAHGLWPKLPANPFHLLSAGWKPLLHAIMQRRKRDNDFIFISDRRRLEEVKSAFANPSNALMEIRIHFDFDVSLSQLPLPSPLTPDWMQVPWPAHWQISDLNEALWLHREADPVRRKEPFAPAHLALEGGEAPTLNDNDKSIFGRNLSTLPPHTLLNLHARWLCYETDLSMLPQIESELVRRGMPILRISDYGLLTRQQRLARQALCSSEEDCLDALEHFLSEQDHEGVSRVLQMLRSTLLTFTRLMPHFKLMTDNNMFASSAIVQLLGIYLQIYGRVRLGAPTAEDLRHISTMSPDLKTMLYQEAFLHALDKNWLTIPWMNADDIKAGLVSMLTSVEMLDQLEQRQHEHSPLMLQLRPYL